MFIHYPHNRSIEMGKRRFYFLEPSKVGRQHITLIEGYLTALISSRSIVENFELILCASKSTLSTLPSTLLSGFRCRYIPVMNPEKRRLIRKSLVELFVVLRYLVKLRQGDILFISCVLPTTLWLIEILNRLFRRSGVYVVLHGEVEGLFEKSPQSFQRIGYWTAKWLRSRKSGSRILLVVLDDFIRDKLVQEFPGKLNVTNVFVIHHPVGVIFSDVENDRRSFTVCFIGYRTQFKGFDDFCRIASVHSSVSFRAIGGGKVENIRDGTIEYLNSKDAYLMEISKCSVALLPCTSGYSCSLSAAALDALSTGVYIIALDQPFFRSLASYFGSDTVTVCSTFEELSLELDTRKLLIKQESRASRLERISRSKYGYAAVQRSFEKLLFNVNVPFGDG